MDRAPVAGPGRYAPDLNTPPARPLLALQADDVRLQERIRLALQLGYASRILAPPAFASSWRELAELGAQHPGSPALVDPDFQDRSDPNDSASSWASPRHWVDTPLIRYSVAAARPGKHELNRKGLPFVASLHVGQQDELNAIDAAILRCTDMRRARSLLARLEQTADPYTHRAFGGILELAIGAPSVGEVAARVGNSQRTFYRRCAALRIPSPQAIVSLARIYTVERLSAWSGQPSGSVALALGFSDRANYRRLVRRTLGAPPSAIRNLGGVDYVAAVILARLSGERGG